MVLATTDIGVCVVTLAAVVLLYMLRRSSHPPYPPGPKSLPLLGSIFEMPENRQWLTYARWSQELGSPILYFNLLGTPMVIVNDFETARDLFDKRGDIYSQRPRLPMLNEALGFIWNFGFSSDHELWKACRREFDPHFRQVAARTFRESEVSMTHQLLQKLLDSPERFMQHLRYMTGSLILDIAYGIKVKQNNDEFIEIAERAQEGMEKSADKNIIDILPWVQHLPSWLPGMGWKKEVDICKEWSLSMLNTPFAFVKKQLEKGAAKSCLATDLLEKWTGPETSPEKREYIIKCLTATAYSAGSDSTVAGFNTLVFTMMMFPEIQKKAQEQLDRVVGSDRLPTFEDIDDLPYITAIVREILRWGAFVPIAVPHQTSAADIYKGYYIPKGAVVIGNAWAILHNPETYPEPERFNPDRFMTADGQLDPNVPKPDQAFGFGRRLCPGRFMAIDSMSITVACLLATFKFSKPNGESVKPEDKLFSPEHFQSGLVVHPWPFKCDIRPRSNKAIEVIRAASLTHED